MQRKYQKLYKHKTNEKIKSIKKCVFYFFIFIYDIKYTINKKEEKYLK